MITRALAADDDGAPSATAAAAALPGAARDTIGAERSEILAHKCHEALKTLGPGGVAVAVVGSEHVRDRAAIWKNGPKRVEQLLAGPPVSDSLIAVALPSVAVERRSRSGGGPAAPAGSAACGWPGRSCRRSTGDAHRGGSAATRTGVAAVQAAVEHGLSLGDA